MTTYVIRTSKLNWTLIKLVVFKIVSIDENMEINIDIHYSVLYHELRKRDSEGHINLSSAFIFYLLINIWSPHVD